MKDLGRGAAARVEFVDAARLIGIFLVYYGHVVERFMHLGQVDAALQYKFIYAFHMPFFFLIAGMVGKDLSAALTPGAFLWSRVTSRIVPFLFFNLLLALVSLLHRPDFPPFPLESWVDYGNAALATFTWLPYLNVPTWFLMALVSVEIIHYVVFRYLRGSTARIAVAALLFYAIGYVLNREYAFFPFKNIWLWNEAITMYAFYLVGILLMRLGIAHWLALRRYALALAVLGIAIVYFSYDLNEGPFRLDYDAVVIVAAAHGHYLWFPLTALAGSLALLAAGQFIAGFGWVRYLGRNVMVIFCLNGLFYHHVNGPFADSFSGDWSLTAFGLTVAATLLSLACIAVTVPLVYLLNTWLPQLIGRPQVSGPLLPRLG
jgi:acyltransferase